MINYKNTLNLPKTDFSMRGNLIKLEPNILRYWDSIDLYNLIRIHRKNREKFFLHDGPPYANGNIHIGHAINKILKDIILKTKTLSGYDAPYIPGWDCHGLPIEINVEKNISKSNKKIDKKKFIQKCYNYVEEQIKNQKFEFIRLGVIGDWNNPYLTMKFSTEANIIRVLGKLISYGYLYKGNKPVHWCIECKSSLAEAEVEYFNKKSLSVYFLFKIVNKLDILSKLDLDNFDYDISLIAWTTTVWTIPANRAIAVNPKINYQLIELNQKGYIISENSVQNLMKLIKCVNYKVISNFKGKELHSLQLYHPFIKNFIVPTIFNENINPKSGTGIVHIAPCHGEEDYVISKKYSLKTTNLIGFNGCYLNKIKPNLLRNIKVFEADKIIIKLLCESNTLIYYEKLKHSYPHCWRHRTPIIFLATPQWFINIDKNNLRQKLLEEIEKVNWIPDRGKNYMKNMVINRPDWCISRQRTWGVPITLFVHNITGELHPNTSILINKIAKLIEQYGIQAWWDLNIDNFLDNDESKCYSKTKDILDVWFDSGSSYYNIIKERAELKKTVSDIYLEGSDQYRGWFMSSLIISTAIYNKSPYFKVITHGFAVDEKGRKMSKSLGNVITPQEIINKFGADVLRLWVASNNYTNEIIISDTILKQSTDNYRRIRNTVRFLLANLNDFDPCYYDAKTEFMVEIDLWMINKTYEIQKKIIKAYNKYNFNIAVQYIINFCCTEMGSFYLDIIKDRQYTVNPNNIARLSCQVTMYHILECLVRWISPILSFTADEIWKLIPGKRSKSVFTEEWYDFSFIKKLNNNQVLNENYWKVLIKIRDTVNKAIEIARKLKIVNASLEAKVILYTNSYITNILHKVIDELHFMLLVSKVELENYSNAGKESIQCKHFQNLKVTVTKANGIKCQRCWHYETSVGKNADYLEICYRCINNMTGFGERRTFF